LSPHLGFAYQLRPQTVIRGGYGTSTVNLLGLFESGINLVGGGGSIGYAYTAFFFDQPTGITDTPYNWDGGFPLAIPPLPNLSPNISNNTTVASWLPHDFKAGRTQNISFGVEQELPHSFVVKLGYVGNLSHGQPAAYITVYSSIDPKYASLGNVLSESVTSADAVAAGIKVPYPGFVGTVARSLSKYPQFVDTYNIAEHIGFSLYHSFQATVQKRYGDLSFLSSYTISKQLDNYNSFGGPGEAYTFGMVQNNAFVSKYKKPADNDLGFFRDFARKKGPLAGQHTQEVETLLPSPLFFRDLCG